MKARTPRQGGESSCGGGNVAPTQSDAWSARFDRGLLHSIRWSPFPNDHRPCAWHGTTRGPERHDKAHRRLLRENPRAGFNRSNRLPARVRTRRLDGSPQAPATWAITPTLARVGFHGRSSRPVSPSSMDGWTLFCRRRVPPVGHAQRARRASRPATVCLDAPRSVSAGNGSSER